MRAGAFYGRMRFAGLLGLDGVATAASLFLALSLRMNGNIPHEMMAAYFEAAPVVMAVSGIAFYFTGLYRRVWRFVSVADFWAIAFAVTAGLGIAYVVLAVFSVGSDLPRSVPFIQWFILTVFLGCTRVLRREVAVLVRRMAGPVHHRAPEAAKNALIAGPPEKVEALLRMLEVEPTSKIHPVGILDSSGENVSRRLRGIPILGDTDALELATETLAANGQRPDCLILAESADAMAGAQLSRLVSRAESLDLSVVRTSDTLLGSTSQPLELRPVELSQLLGRPQANLDLAAITRAIEGRRVLVTGAGGTIGGELVRQIAAMRPSKLILLDIGEFNLYKIDLELQENLPDVPRVAELCCIRQRSSLLHIFDKYRPELVFHAAALKHVPLVEANVCAGALTNVIGTRNVVDAAVSCGATAMVQISTDKAVNPVGMMGATKRLGELYCQALDLKMSSTPGAPRFIVVRFGNVLGSSGSLVPLFERQLSRRGPLTVTHPDVTRFFMTAHEAVQLILQGTQRALRGEGRRGHIFVLDMGEPVKILDIAKRMIRLAGLRPGIDVQIKFVGLRPGEKLHEELFASGEKLLPSTIEGIFEAEPVSVNLEGLTRSFLELEAASANNNEDRARAIVRSIVAKVSSKEQAGVEKLDKPETMPARRPSVAAAPPKASTVPPAAATA